MRRLLCCLAALFPLAFFAQWTGLPSSPLPLCTVSSAQSLPISMPDGDGGWYAFWRDARNGNMGEVWGQRLSANGEYLWEPEGRPVFAVPGRSLTSFHVDGDQDQGFMVAATIVSIGSNFSTDTVLVMRVDGDAVPVWNEPVAIGGWDPSMGNNYTCATPLVAMHADGSAHVAWVHVPGNFPRISLNVIEADGTLPEGFNGLHVEAGSNGTRHLFSDGQGGVFMVWQATGTTSVVRVWRFGANLEPAWPNLMQFPQGGGNVGTFHTLPDGEGGLYLTYIGLPGNDVFLTRIAATGQQPWTPAVLPVADVDGIQQRPRLGLRDDHLFVAWDDARPVTPGIHVQKFTTAGAPLWATNGVRMVGTSSGSTFPRIAGLPDGGAMVVWSSPGYGGGRVASDGSMVWSNAATLANNTPLQTWHELHATPMNGGVAIWQTQSSRLFAAEVLPDGTLSGPTSIQELDGVQRLEAWPVPATHEIFVRLPEGLRDLRFTLHGSDGRQVQGVAFNATSDLLRMDVSGLSAGWYVLRAVGGSTTYQVRFVKQ
ncbi:MAG: hypothetical protein KF905_09375 [Flavobacteriales bacterium]|nr:hypothetical protein [Flavobacteriales bacterium]